MRTLDFETVASSFRGGHPADADFALLGETESHAHVHLALSRTGAAALLVPLSSARAAVTRVTHGAVLRCVPQLEYTCGAERRTVHAAVVECRAPALLRTFSAMAVAMIARLEASNSVSWETVASLFGEWEHLLGRRRMLDGEGEIGLWAELWCIARTRAPDTLLSAWTGPEREHFDFVLNALAIEVKCSRRARVHTVSQIQVDVPNGDVPRVLLSIHVSPDPTRGSSLASLVRTVSARVSNAALFEERLAGIGYSREDEDAYHRAYVVVQAPAVYDMNAVPRVRIADAGVSHLRYQVELPPDGALEGQRRAHVFETLGFEPSSYGYPCV